MYINVCVCVYIYVPVCMHAHLLMTHAHLHTHIDTYVDTYPVELFSVRKLGSQAYKINLCGLDVGSYSEMSINQAHFAKDQAWVAPLFRKKVWENRDPASYSTALLLRIQTS